MPPRRTSGLSKMKKTSKNKIKTPATPSQQLVAVLEESPRGGTDSPGDSISNGYASSAPSPEPLPYFPHLEYREPIRGEIEVNEDVLKASRLKFLLFLPVFLSTGAVSQARNLINTLQLVSLLPVLHDKCVKVS